MSHRRGDLVTAPIEQQGEPVGTAETPRTRTSIVTVVNAQPPKFTYADVDGDRLLITTADIPDAGGGVYFKTDPNGSSVPLSELPALIEKLKEIADAAGEQS
jgi:hypothetical protein